MDPPSYQETMKSSENKIFYKRTVEPVEPIPYNLSNSITKVRSQKVRTGK